MFLDEYVKKEKVMTLEQFKSMGENGSCHDFLRQGIEPDRTDLTKEIYKNIFPWYNDSLHSGDTLNTYRSAIMRIFFESSYSLLDRATQKRILYAIKGRGNYFEDHLFEFEVLGKKGQTYKQVCNNYQLGNFGIFPKGKINVARSKSPYNDYFDMTLIQIHSFYQGELEEGDDLKNAILEEADYFNQFEDFIDFIEKNYLDDFFDEHNNLILLSEIEDFEEYVVTVNHIIQSRGRRIIAALTGKDFEDVGQSLSVQSCLEAENQPKYKSILSFLKLIGKFYGVLWEELGFKILLTTSFLSFFNVIFLFDFLGNVYRFFRKIVQPVVRVSGIYFYFTIYDILSFIPMFVYPVFCLIAYPFVRLFWIETGYSWIAERLPEKSSSSESLFRPESLQDEIYALRKEIEELKNNKNKKEEEGGDFDGIIVMFTLIWFTIKITVKLIFNFLLFSSSLITFPFAIRYIKKNYLTSYY